MMSKAQHNLEVELALAWERGDEYWATVTVTATDSCYHAGELKVGLPPHKERDGAHRNTELLLHPFRG